jgi:hypothetical protein
MKRKRAVKRTPPARGNFADFAKLFEQLESAPVFELGKPAPKERYMPKAKVGSCPAAHKRALIGEEMH